MRPREHAHRIEEVDYVDPWRVVAARPELAEVCLLETTSTPTSRERYALLGLSPLLVFEARRARCYQGPPGDLRPLAEPPLEALARLLREHRPPQPFWREGLPPFLGGAMGYLGYEVLHQLEQVPDLGRDELGLPDARWVFYGAALVSDQLARRTWLCAHGFGSSAKARTQVDARLCEAQAAAALGRTAAPPTDRWLAHKRSLLEAQPALSERAARDALFEPAFDRGAYLELVALAKEHILRGDVFELCTTNRFLSEARLDGAKLYEVLRAVNAAPMSAYLRFENAEVLCASPERFLSLDRARRVETRPIKGTRPRGRTPDEDAALAQQLAHSDKDRAENLMIVDLARNDLGRVCELGSVRVPQLTVVESHAFTHQLVSTVEGRLREGLGPIDAIKAAFPGGSMTGAPKIEAMRLIEAFEPVQRGVYSGALGYLDYEGAFDLNIVIRTLVRSGDRWSFHVGGAVVSDSEPEQEHQEMLDKAHGLVLAVEVARACR